MGGSGSEKDSKLFKLEEWKFVHIEIPIYKYWVLSLIQIFVPLIILSVLSLFIFEQANGKNDDGESTFNVRIANSTALLLAYIALIPMIREQTPSTTYLSFVHINIGASILPLILVLISSIHNMMVNNS
jgi:hypothetical protein